MLIRQTSLSGSSKSYFIITDRVDNHLRSRLEKWIDHSNRVYRRLERIKGNDTDNEYIDRLFSMFITEYTAGRSAQHVFNDALATFRKFYDSMARCSAGILQEAGVGADFEDVEEKLTGICSIIKCIEAMQCETMASEAILKS